jgi:hypothetical protein
MHVWTDIGGAVCVAVSVVGLVLSWRIWRKNGATRGMRAVAWSLLPLAAYLTHSIALLGRVVNAFILFAGSFVFSAKAYAGIIVVAVAVVLFLVSGGLPLRNSRKSRKQRKAAKAAKADGAQPEMAAVGTGSADNGSSGNGGGRKGKSKAPVPRGSADDDDDLGDIQEILRRRGIN